MLKEFLSGIWRDRFILASLVNKDLQLKYRRSKLGVAWAIITPLGLAVIIGSVYSIIFGTDPREFIPTLFAGLNPWLFVCGTLEGGTMVYIAAEGYLKQTSVNPQIFPLRITLLNYVNLLYSILAYFCVYMFLQPAAFSPRMLLSIPGLLLLFLSMWGGACIVSIIHLNVRDYQPLQSLILQGLFYATPIIFPASMLAEKGFSFVYRINPIYYLIDVVRTPMLGKTLPSWDVYLIAILITLVLFFGGVYVVMKYRKQITFKL